MKKPQDETNTMKTAIVANSVSVPSKEIESSDTVFCHDLIVAQWGTFFDYLELHVFSSPTIRDCGFCHPSFYLPAQRHFGPGMFFDVAQSESPDSGQRQGYDVLSVQSEISIGILRPIPQPARDGLFDSCIHEIYCAGGGWDLGQAFCRCTECGMIGFAFEGRSARIPCECRAIRTATGDYSDRDHNSNDPLLITAYRQALRTVVR
jgi:hypothetical protein